MNDTGLIKILYEDLTPEDKMTYLGIYFDISQARPICLWMALRKLKRDLDKGSVKARDIIRRIQNH
ncbi:MAG: hypothetical protein EAX96_05725 [Candidatus Lokiarchaeota archaeon]|nr:hypothetical protein [Candidatus Lokiarchaeota archaeon]